MVYALKKDLYGINPEKVAEPGKTELCVGDYISIFFENGKGKPAYTGKIKVIGNNSITLYPACYYMLMNIDYEKLKPFKSCVEAFSPVANERLKRIEMAKQAKSPREIADIMDEEIVLHDISSMLCRGRVEFVEKATKKT
jgi:hypothetical protein